MPLPARKLQTRERGEAPHAAVPRRAVFLSPPPNAVPSSASSASSPPVSVSVSALSKNPSQPTPPQMADLHVLPTQAPYFFATLKTREYREHRNASQSIRSIAWNNQGNRIATGLSDKLVRVWNPEKPEIRNSTELKGHTQGVDRVAWDPTHSDRLASCGGDGGVRLWDYRSAKCLATIPTNSENTSLAYHPTGSVIAVSTKDEKTHFLEPRTNTILSTHSESAQTNQLIFSHTGSNLLSTTSQGKVLLRDYPSMDLIYTVNACSSGALCLELDPRGAHLAVGGSDAVVSVWDTKEWICQRTLRSMEGPVRSVSFSFDGAYLVAGSDEIGTQGIDIAHVDTGDVVHTVPTTHAVPNVAWHPKMYWLAYSGDSSGLKIVGVAGGG